MFICSFEGITSSKCIKLKYTNDVFFPEAEMTPESEDFMLHMLGQVAKYGLFNFS